MKTYSTYQEAKIENPTGDIYINKMNGMFSPDLPQGLSSYWLECKPADYCMTVDKFLSAGHKFVSGDITIDAGGLVHAVDDCELWNEKSEADCDRYILRAAALDPKKPRTRVEYVKCEFSHAWEAVKEFECGQVFFRDTNIMIPTDDVNYVAIDLIVDILVFHNAGNLYRKVETEIDERQEFIDAAYKAAYFSGYDDFTRGMAGAIFDSGKFKYIGGDDADK